MRATIGATRSPNAPSLRSSRALDANDDRTPQPPAISTGIYFGLGAEHTTETAVDGFVLNSYVFDFEPMGCS